MLRFGEDSTPFDDMDDVFILELTTAFPLRDAVGEARGLNVNSATSAPGTRVGTNFRGEPSVECEMSNRSSPDDEGTISSSDFKSSAESRADQLLDGDGDREKEEKP